ncbi:MAG: hypothetical protein JO165_10745 [Candidatus Eremiobacteraeota bacterium]|nr:hypothetical protein [Candidatus Eremiobacteraeota bacterium]
MTITEHLEFSVVSAPLAQIDRRALSQAWYSALYECDAVPAKAPPSRAKPISSERTSIAEKRSCGRAPRKSSELRPERRAPASSPLRSGAAQIERRAARSALARNIERRFLHPGPPAKAATFQLQGDRGRVQILLRNSGDETQLVAICAPSARRDVAAALAQARYALAVRGITLRSEVREASA